MCASEVPSVSNANEISIGVAGPKTADLAAWLWKSTVPTVIGDLSWDAKGDITRQRLNWYTWQNGQYLDAPK